MYRITTDLIIFKLPINLCTMKKFIPAILFVFVSSGVFAQSQKDKPAAIDRKALIREYLQLDEADDRKFWKVYDEYYDKMKENRKERFERFQEFVETDSIPERELRKLVKVNSFIKQLDAMLLEQYYDILRKRISSEVAGKFYHFEDAMNSITLGERYKQWDIIQDLKLEFED